MPLRQRLRRRTRAVIRRAAAPLIRERLEVASQAAALRQEIALVEQRIDRIAALAADLCAQGEQE